MTMNKEYQFPTGAQRGERVFLLVIVRKGKNSRQRGDIIAEMRELIYSCGGNVVDSMVVVIDRPTPGYFLRHGKLDELKVRFKMNRPQTLVTSIDLSPVQGRNLSEFLNLKVIDRTALILDIFAQHAKSKDGKLQVELAQLTYLLPRLSSIWEKFSRLGGGIGTRGPGEQILERDRRKIRKRISKLHNDLERLKTHRDLVRKSRKRKELFIVAIVGYTNAGKSTLLKRLTGAEVIIEDKLFATLDPITRRYVLPNGKAVLFTDTVGFLLDLPHTLIKSFHGTLEEIAEANLVVVMLDLSNPEYAVHYEVVQKILKEVHAESTDQIIALNKIDRINESEQSEALKTFPDGVAISAQDGHGVRRLINAIQTKMDEYEYKNSLSQAN